MLARYKEIESNYSEELEKAKKENKNSTEIQNKLNKTSETKEEIKSLYESVK